MHYKIDPLSRWDMDEIMMLIAQKKYFILHAPRQTGKTSCLLALRDRLNSEDDYCCVYANFEMAQVTRNDVARGMLSITSELSQRLKKLFALELNAKSFLTEADGSNALNQFLVEVCHRLNKPLVLLIDEIDALVGDTLISVLRQLRAGYDARGDDFPISVILCGVRDIKDYRIRRADDEIITGGSCFNIKSKSLTMGNFSQDEIKKLYFEHTKYTGQEFEDECFELIWRYTNGQPWLVNALGYEVTYEMKENRARTKLITEESMIEAKNRLVISRATHLDQLTDKLREDRVRSVIQPLLIGEMCDANPDDVEYCIDLGLVRNTLRGLAVSNDIYMEVLPRELSKMEQEKFKAFFAPDWVNDDESLNDRKLMEMFQQFWRENSEIWKTQIAGYNEAIPHLVFQGFLQRVSNGHGTIDREYGLGRKRADLYLRWKSPVGEQRIVFELKIRNERCNTAEAFDKLIAEGVEQTAIYSDKCNATDSHLIIFDRRENIAWDEKIGIDSVIYNKRTITIWKM
jgi:hypothetical protein